MSHYLPKLRTKTGLLFFILFIPGIIFSQTQTGMVLSAETKSGIGFVNVGIVGRNVGTVADESGNFTLPLDSIYNNDSLRFSMIGYESKSFLVSQFKENSIKKVYLSPRFYDLQEVTVIYHKAKVIRIGNPVPSSDLKSGFAYNNLGSELGVMVNVRGQVKLLDLNLNIGTCTYDSVTYRINIYQLENQAEYRNILTRPIYVSFTKDRINNAVTFDLRKYSIVIEGKVLITLELFKDLGNGSLLFQTEFFTGTTYHRKTSQGNWVEAAGAIGMYLHGQVIR
jgi:hypothetical protein